MDIPRNTDTSIIIFGFPGGSVIKNLPASTEDGGDSVQSLGQEDPLEKEMQPTLVFLPGKIHGQRNPVGYSPWVAKGWTRPSTHAHYLYL